MHSYFRSPVRTAVAALAVTIGVSGCNDFLRGPGISENPNDPVSASLDALFVGMQGRQFVLQQGQLARNSAIWTQQLAGIFNQQREWGSQYNYTENDISGHYAGFYIGGGLNDLRKIQAEANAAGNVRLEGIAKVWEAFSMGTAASLWGDIVYSEAVNPEIATPQLDPQEQVYAAVQALLSSAITQLQGASNTADLPSDLVYSGRSDRWARAANTLKARYFLHVAPRQGAAAYTAALNAANAGINEAPTTAAQAIHGQAPGDLRSFHGNTLDDGNIWAQFDEARTDLAANHRYVTVMQNRGDPRLAEYFSPNGGVFRGANQFGLSADGSTAWSGLNRTTRVPRTFRQPFVTWAENQFIIAEAQFQLGQPGSALTAVNNVRVAVGLPALAGPITLEEIMVEKWIAQFQNIDAYSDYRRTCFPVLVPGGPSAPTPAAQVPGRFFYGSSERLQNPNIPPPSQQPAKNWNFAEITCPTSGGTI